MLFRVVQCFRHPKLENVLEQNLWAEVARFLRDHSVALLALLHVAVLDAEQTAEDHDRSRHICWKIGVVRDVAVLQEQLERGGIFRSKRRKILTNTFRNVMQTRLRSGFPLFFGIAPAFFVLRGEFGGYGNYFVAGGQHGVEFFVREVAVSVLHFGHKPALACIETIERLLIVGSRNERGSLILPSGPLRRAAVSHSRSSGPRLVHRCPDRQWCGT
mmetsp:Transcript_7849/g.24471  ORF Transcript_7849/g.24471 Transcript_7849/m.24471 type:complete len:216 (-) Transcript_7849:326-973(-)